MGGAATSDDLPTHEGPGDDPLGEMELTRRGGLGLRSQVLAGLALGIGVGASLLSTSHSVTQQPLSL